ncbi:sensor histidine kinase [Candidatus Halobonum tyrrellensis]|uniref:histidine kinase n=1 Tax=Candidatus Halobonum tyrrellensis G22 TaxID=1324957 RepID=V4IVX4_9EURY|nr:PAS domain-containing sensor histidine kinase [Candidatus Halobonum tyrrellensis]ESP87297.1 pas domain s-box [Candidatus Halobonum tyrrellensis G22]
MYRRAFRETVIPAIISDTNFVITDVNRALLSTFGYDREDVVGSIPTFLFNDEGVYREVIDALSEGESWVGDFEATTDDGRLIHGRGSATPLVVDGTVEGYVAMFTDMTRHRRYEESLRILNRVLRHNLRNDANVVLGHLERAADLTDDPDVAASLATATARVEDMLARARTTRRFSGILTDADTSSLKPVDLAAAVEQALADVCTRGVDLTLSGTDDPVEVLADDMLVPALQAVIENAVEHNDKDRPELDLRVTAEDDRVTLSVADNGPGIARSQRDTVLGREEHTQVEHGEGLSLFFVDQLMELYGGDVSVCPNGDVGTVFALRFRRPDESGERAATDAGDTDGGLPTADRSEVSAADADTGGATDGSGTDADERARELAAAGGPSVTPARLLGDPEGLPRSVDVLDEDDPVHHLIGLRRDDPIHREGTADVPFRGAAAALLTDDALRVVVAGGAGGTWTLPYADLVAVGRRDDTLVLDTGAGRFHLRLSRSGDEDESVAAALSFLEAKITGDE